MKTFATIILELERMDANMSSKPKYSIGEIVKIKATGEKVKINDWYCNTDKIWYDVDTINNGYFFGSYFESELKPYRPSRTGKYRNERGQFMSKKCDCCGWDEMGFAHEPFCSLIQPDSKQTNYQKIEKLKDSSFYVWDVNGKEIQGYEYLNKITTTLERIEKKIDELGKPQEESIC